jgi:hypothetical protein
MPYKILTVVVMASLMLSSSIESQQSSVQSIPLKKDEAWICVRWQWVYTALEQKVNCVEWAKKDCSNRLYPELCKRGG